MRNPRCLRAFALAFFGFFLLFGCIAGRAAVPYPSFSFDAWDARVPCPAPYEPVNLIDGYDIRQEDKYSLSGWAVVPLSQPAGLTFDDRGHLYVADAGNSRVVEFDDEFHFVRVIGGTSGKSRLSRPQGVFVDDDGLIYVADTGNRRVAKFAPDGVYLEEYTRPQSSVLGDSYRFAPVSVVVDRLNNLYIVTEGGYRGLVCLAQDGSFQGFFGGNQAGFDLMWAIKRLFFTEEQLRQEARRLPGSPVCAAIDGNGLIYTATMGVNHGQIKRFSLGGVNTIPDVDYGDRGMRVGTSRFTGIDVDDEGFITAVDSSSGQIFQYTPRGELLYVFGWKGIAYVDRMGVLNQASGVAVREDGIIAVADSRASNIHVYQPTEFARAVQKAVSLYEDGLYGESKQYWEQVLRMNANYDLAHKGLARAAYQEENWREAMAEFRLAADRDGYSESFWWLRREWLLQHADAVLLVGVIAWLCGYIVLRVWTRRHRGQRRHKRSVVSGLVGDLMHAFQVLKRPGDTFYEVRWEGRGSIPVAVLLVAAAFATRLFELYKTNLTFLTIDVERINVTQQAMMFVLPFVLWVIANHLVSSLKSGEGRFRDILIGSAYALLPYIIVHAPLVVISQGLTSYEQTVYSFLAQTSWLWTGILLFVMVQTIHNYDVLEAVPNCIYSIVVMVIIGAIGGLVLGLTQNVIEFGSALYQEVLYRVF